MFFFETQCRGVQYIITSHSFLELLSFRYIDLNANISVSSTANNIITYLIIVNVKKVSNDLQPLKFGINHPYT